MSQLKYQRVTYIADQFLYDFSLARDGSGLDSILVKLILLGQSNRLLPAFVLAIDVRRNLAEEDKVVALEALCQFNGIVIIVVFNRVAKSLVILLLN